MQPNNWEKDGKTVYDVKVNVRNFNFVDPKDSGGSQEDIPF